MIVSIVIILVYLHVQQAMASIDHDCSQISLLSKGGYLSLEDAPTSGETATWSYPLYVIESETQGTREVSKEVGRWHGYCITLGEKDFALSRLCHHVYNINQTGISGFFTGSNLDSGEDVAMVAITGGVGGQIDASGGLNITYMAGSGTYYHDTILCFAGLRQL
jgi:hypothetical protein